MAHPPPACDPGGGHSHNLEALLQELVGQLELGERRAREALLELRGGARQAAPPSPDLEPARPKLQPGPADEAVPPADGGEPAEEEDGQQRGGGPGPAASQPRGDVSGGEMYILQPTQASSRSLHSRAMPRMHAGSRASSRTSGSVISWFSRLESLVPSQSRRAHTAAMEMIEHDSIRSYDLRSLWRTMVRSSGSQSQIIGSRVSWSIRRFVAEVLLGPPSSLRLSTQKVVRSSRYEVCVMLLIVANAVFLGWQVQHEALTRKPVKCEREVEAFFCVVFAMELLLKIYAFGLRFFCGGEGSWNSFDLAVVLLMLLDFFTSISQEMRSGFWTQASGLRIFRVLRVIRFLRSVRQLKFFTQLRIMIRSIMFSLKPLLWASLVLSGMFYVFGLCLTQGVIDHLQKTNSWDDASSSDMLQYFGTLERCALSLFEAMSGGINWGELFDTLSPLAFPFQCVFLFFVLFAIFGAANVVTGIFVEIANNWAQNDSHAQIQAESEQKAFFIRALHELFCELDTAGHGSLTLEGMQEAIATGDDRLVSSFHALELEIMDVRTLFLLLDRDRKGYVSTDEFLLGCFRLKGEARTLDIMKLQYQCEWIMHNMVSMMDTLNHLDALEKTEPSLHPGTDDAGPARSATPVAQLNV